MEREGATALLERKSDEGGWIDKRKASLLERKSGEGGGKRKLSLLET